MCGSDRPNWRLIVIAIDAFTFFFARARGQALQLKAASLLVVTFAVANRVLWPVLKFDLAPDWRAHGYSFESALALLGVASGVGGVIGGILVRT
jgi:hypothetical protein